MAVSERKTSTKPGRNTLLWISVILIIIGLMLFNYIGLYSLFLDILGVLSLIYSIYQGSVERGKEQRIIDEIKKLDKTDQLGKTLRRVRSSLKEVGISTEDLVKEYDHPLKAMLIFKFRERISGRKSVVLRDKIRELGFKYIQSGVYVLPPVLTPSSLETREDIGKWFKSAVVDPIGPNLEYVIPFAVLIDLRKAYSERKAPERAWGRTIFGVLGPDELFPPEYIIGTMNRKHISLEDIIRLGDITFLAAGCLTDSELLKVQENKRELISQIQYTLGTRGINLSEYKKMDSEKLASMLRRFVDDPARARHIAETIVNEAIFWDKFLKEKL